MAKEEKELMARSAGVIAGYGAGVAAASTATPAIPAVTVTLGAKMFVLAPAVAAAGPIIAPVLAVGLVGAGATYLVKKIFE